MIEYNLIDKFFHKCILEYTNINELIFNLERKIFLDKFEINDSVFITGMARSGTTTMLNALYNTNEFASLTYEDMPFILAPNFWNKINKSHKNNIIYKERSHGDGIQISIKSPEAFEEVFWRVFSKDNYIFEKSLKKYELSQEIICLFKDFQKLVCIKNKKKDIYRKIIIKF